MVANLNGCSQVNMVNFSPSGNHSIIKWEITPADSTEYLSNATAVVSKPVELQLLSTNFVTACLTI